LWAAGLVELVTKHAARLTLTEQVAYWRTAYATVKASPDAAYDAFRRQLATPADDPYEFCRSVRRRIPEGGGRAAVRACAPRRSHAEWPRSG
jgi:hypothetical protein